jgi:hypothetical protein
MCMYTYCHVWSVLGILFYCVVLCIVCVQMCTVPLPPGVNPIAVNKYFVSHHINTTARTPNLAHYSRRCPTFYGIPRSLSSSQQQAFGPCHPPGVSSLQPSNIFQFLSPQPKTSEWYFLFSIPSRNLACTSNTPQVCQMSCPSHPSWLDSLLNISRKVLLCVSLGFHRGCTVKAFSGSKEDGPEVTNELVALST